MNLPVLFDYLEVVAIFTHSKFSHLLTPNISDDLRRHVYRKTRSECLGAKINSLHPPVVKSGV